MRKGAWSGLWLATLMVAGGPSLARGGDTQIGNLKFNGDFRFRLDVDERSGTGVTDANDNRVRPRLRLRAGFVYETPLEGLSFGARLSSNLGLPGNSPHQNLTSAIAGTTPHLVALDRAYLKYAPPFAEGLYVAVGKAAMPWPQQTEMFWDSDIQPEGMLVGFDNTYGDQRITAHLGYYLLGVIGWTDEALQADGMAAWHVRWTGTFEPLKVSLGVYGLHVLDTAGSGPNSDGVIDHGSVNFIGGFAQVKLTVDDVWASIGFDFSTSDAVVGPGLPDYTLGLVGTVRIGWKFLALRYGYYDVGETSVPFYQAAVFAQDNFPNSNGGGMTGFVGHRFDLGLKVGRHFAADVRLYLAEGKPNNQHGSTFAEVSGRELRRIQLNLNLKY